MGKNPNKLFWPTQYVEVKGTPGGEKGNETGSVQPATSVGDWGFAMLGQLQEPVQNVLHSCSPWEASEQGISSASSISDYFEGYSWGALEQLLEENASGRDLRVPEVRPVCTAVKGRGPARMGHWVLSAPCPSTSSALPPLSLIQTVTFFQYYVKCWKVEKQP